MIKSILLSMACCILLTISRAQTSDITRHATDKIIIAGDIGNTQKKKIYLIDMDRM
jgi:uncharacterized membrane protein